MQHEELTGRIIKAYYHVYNSLGPGFLERVYQNALANTLQKAGMQVEIEKPVTVHFEGEVVGEYYADLVVNNLVIVETKAVEKIIPKHLGQLVNYLKATPIEVGLLFNFGSDSPDLHRKIYTNDLKPNLKDKKNTDVTDRADEHG